MKRLALVAAVLVAGVLAAMASAAGPSQKPTLIEGKGPPYPVKTYVLQLPSGQSLTVRNVDVTENGGPVLSPTLVPASHASKEAFGVFVLDTSYSMAGEPLAPPSRGADLREPPQPERATRGDHLWNGSKVALLLTTDPTKISAKLHGSPSTEARTSRRGGPGRGDARGGPHRIGSIVVLPTALTETARRPSARSGRLPGPPTYGSTRWG